MTLLTPRETDRLLRYPQGRAKRLARQQLIPHIVLPDDEIRFDAEAVECWLKERAASVKQELCPSETR
ncbi:MAG: hypothetical protein ACYSVY_01380 [Planctomycetota bacterium]|jgi:hypothetical protein